FKPVGPDGVYETEPLWGGVLRLILLNELADEAHNAALKCFASRQKERKKAFETIKRTGLFRLSEEFSRITVGLWRLQMKGSLNSPEMERITIKQVAQLGKEWLECMADATPTEELFSLLKLDHRLVQERQESRATMLTHLLQRRFGTIPDWAREKVVKADVSTLEVWSLRIFDAQSLDDIFSDKV
ncbi:MAG: DUF4351 domain-containing protein, partial [Magnetococcus sp. DMHC-1]